mmetsp:Transcript_3726/g.12031  ORF Transcript_3726/g.12031 Transcript_3726/m.12031 type:complete len:320 (-) Transcript_3726:739-1698(-)
MSGLASRPGTSGRTSPIATAGCASSFVGSGRGPSRGSSTVAGSGRAGPPHGSDGAPPVGGPGCAGDLGPSSGVSRVGMSGCACPLEQLGGSAPACWPGCALPLGGLGRASPVGESGCACRLDSSGNTNSPVSRSGGACSLDGSGGMFPVSRSGCTRRLDGADGATPLAGSTCASPLCGLGGAGRPPCPLEALLGLPPPPAREGSTRGGSAEADALWRRALLDRAGRAREATFSAEPAGRSRAPASGWRGSPSLPGPPPIRRRLALPGGCLARPSGVRGSGVWLGGDERRACIVGTSPGDGLPRVVAVWGRACRFMTGLR